MVKLSEKDSQIIAIRVVCDGIWRVRSVHVSPIVAMYKPPFEMRRTKTIFRLRLFDSFWWETSKAEDERGVADGVMQR